MEMHSDIIIENPQFRLILGCDCTVKSLLHKASNRECAAGEEEVKLFSVTQERPFHNEVKLTYMNKKTTFQANRVRREGDQLIVGFEIIPYEAVVRIACKDAYITFTLQEFLVDRSEYGILLLELPPVLSFRLLQLPLKHTENFGPWLNVSWNGQVAVNVLATSPYEMIDSEANKHCRILTAEARRDIKLLGTTAALIVTDTDSLLDAVGAVEEDFDLPRGVQSRRDALTYASIYAGMQVKPDNIDEHIARAKQGGFRLFRIYISSLIGGCRGDCTDCDGYAHFGDYDDGSFRDEYPNDIADLKTIVDKIKAAGMIPGFHFLHTFVGHNSHYFAPKVDPRVNIKRYFSLSKPLGKEDTVVYVDRSTVGCPTDDKCRVLNFGGELIHYDGFTTQPPYCFTGCRRGYLSTDVQCHEAGLIGGILDVCEYGGSNSYINQNTDLQDEIAEAIARLYDCGFEYVYYDGSEGVHAPYEFHVPNAQYRVYKKLGKAPLFCEGAAKAHFSWHMLSGGNAFDVFPTMVFKAMIDKHPFAEAEMMAKDFTRVNFGWWQAYADTQPDTFEYGNSRAMGWNCPITLMGTLPEFNANPRMDDVFEVLRRWEDVRAKNWLTPEQRGLLKQPGQEYTLLINEHGDYELVPYSLLPEAAGGDPSVRVYTFTRCGKNYAVCWSPTGKATMCLPLKAADLHYEKELGGQLLPMEEAADGLRLSVEGRAYLSTSLPMDQLTAALNAATIAE